MDPIAADVQDQFGIVAALRTEDSVSQASLAGLQLQDPELVEIITTLRLEPYLQKKRKPESWPYLSQDTC